MQRIVAVMWSPLVHTGGTGSRRSARAGDHASTQFDNEFEAATATGENVSATYASAGSWRRTLPSHDSCIITSTVTSPTVVGKVRRNATWNRVQSPGLWVGSWWPAGSRHHVGQSGMAGVFSSQAGMVSGIVMVVLPLVGTPALAA